MAKLRRIMHPSDFSAALRRAFVRAVQRARANRAQFALVHVMTPVVPMMGNAYSGQGSTRGSAERRAELRQRGVI